MRVECSDGRIMDDGDYDADTVAIDIRGRGKADLWIARVARLRHGEVKYQGGLLPGRRHPFKTLGFTGFKMESEAPGINGP